MQIKSFKKEGGVQNRKAYTSYISFQTSTHTQTQLHNQTTVGKLLVLAFNLCRHSTYL